MSNPLVVTDREYDDLAAGLRRLEDGRSPRGGESSVSRGMVDLPLLDEAVEGLCTKLLYTMPDCLTKTVESLRKHKLEHWDRNRETNRAWLALNMMTEANAGFRAFHEGTKDATGSRLRGLRQRLAQGARWSEDLVPKSRRGQFGKRRRQDDERTETLDFGHGGQVARVVLAAPKANILDAAMIAALTERFTGGCR